MKITFDSSDFLVADFNKGNLSRLAYPERAVSRFWARLI